MKVTYIGDDKTPPNKTTVFGYNFDLNKPVDINDKDVLAKLVKHPCFEVENTKVK